MRAEGPVILTQSVPRPGVCVSHAWARPSSLSVGCPRAVPQGSRCLGLGGEARSRGPSAWVRRTAASAVRGAAPPGPRPRVRSRPQLGPPCQAQTQTHTRRGRRCRDQWTPPPELPSPRPGQRRPLDPRVAKELRPRGVWTRGARPRWAGAARHGGWPRCGRAVRLHPGRPGLRGVGSVLRGVSRPRPRVEATGLRPVPPGRVTRPSFPGAVHPARPGTGREREEGRGEGKEGVVGEGPWGPQGRVPGPAALL